MKYILKTVKGFVIDNKLFDVSEHIYYNVVYPNSVGYYNIRIPKLAHKSLRLFNYYKYLTKLNFTLQNSKIEQEIKIAKIMIKHNLKANWSVKQIKDYEEKKILFNLKNCTRYNEKLILNQKFFNLKNVEFKPKFQTKIENCGGNFYEISNQNFSNFRSKIQDKNCKNLKIKNREKRDKNYSEKTTTDALFCILLHDMCCFAPFYTIKIFKFEPISAAASGCTS